ncbi:S1 family peptidase [Corynebacterium sp. A21]|uniref:S1 family peptidase n=1 Tax=Corynebacterium sp. A21 TaxID=3457318 RepID=UPI003FD3CBB8
MRRKHRLRSYIIAGVLGGAALFAVPAAGADELPAASAGIVDQVRGDLAALGIQTPEIDPAVSEAVDKVYGQATGTASASPAVAPENAAESPRQIAEYARVDGPNYHWNNDISSKALAGSATGPVLQRVQGSYFDAPDTPQESYDAQEQGISLYGPGTPIFVGDSMMCTLGVAGYDDAGRKVGLTAGHCGQEGDVVMSADSWEIGQSGTVVASNAGKDYSVIEFADNAQVTNSYNGFTINSIGGQTPGVGEQLCKQGVATGYSCGNTWTANEAVTIAQVCAMQGDSGAPVVRGGQMVGMISGGLLPFYQLQCQTPLQGQMFMPTVITNMNSVLADLNASGGVGTGFRVAS